MKASGRAKPSNSGMTSSPATPSSHGTAPPGPCWPRSTGPDELLVAGIGPGAGAIVPCGVMPCPIAGWPIMPDRLAACAPIETAVLRQTNFPCLVLP